MSRARSGSVQQLPWPSAAFRRLASALSSRLLLALCLGAPLSGCAWLNEQMAKVRPEPVTPPEPALGEREVSGLLAYYSEIRDAPERVIERERLLHQAALQAGRCDPTRLRLALVFLRGAELQARQEIPEDLLLPCLIDPTLTEGGVRGFAALLQTQLRQSAAQAGRVRAAAQETEALKKENVELRRQLEGLKAIERSLQDRRRRQSDDSRSPNR